MPKGKKSKASVDQKLDEVFGVESPVSSPQAIDPLACEEIALIPVIGAPLVATTSNPEQDREADFAFTRQAMHNLLAKVQDLTNNALHFAKERQDPGSIKAANETIREERETILAIQDLQRTRTRTEDSGVKRVGDTYNQLVLNGTTSEMLKMMRSLPAEGPEDSEHPAAILDNTPFKQPKNH